MNVEKHKQCFKCGESKPLSAFYKHPRMADGHVNKCIACNRKDVNENRQLKLDYYQEYDRFRGNQSNLSVTEHQEQGWTVDVVKTRVERRSEYRRKHPERLRANSAVSAAINAGKLTRPTNCEYCGKECKPQAHHASYADDMQLVVTWLCTKCHGQTHCDY